MQRRLRNRERPSAASVRLALPIAFALTVLSFIGSTAIAQHRASGNEDAAESIALKASPSIYHLAKARTEMRHMQVLLAEYARKVSRGKDAGAVAARIRSSRELLDRDWRAYLVLPPYPGEAGVRAEIAVETKAMDASVSAVMGRLDSVDVEDVVDDEVSPTIERLDEGIVRAIELNSREAAVLASRIAAVRAATRTLAFALNAASVLFAAVAAILLERVIHHNEMLMRSRLSELEMFAGRVAHDIRSPLAAVGLALGLTRRVTEIDSATRARLERAARSLQRVGEVVDGLLVFARSGAAPSGGAHADVAVVLKEVTDELLPAAKNSEIDLRIERLDACVIRCSPGVLTSILSNLIENALKYMGDAPLRRVLVRVSDEGTFARFEIEDTGPGVPKEMRERIFDPHVRAAAASIPGLGLGLATVRKLVEAHGGSVRVESGSLGGSLFWLELPKLIDRDES